MRSSALRTIPRHSIIGLSTAIVRQTTLLKRSLYRGFAPARITLAVFGVGAAILVAWMGTAAHTQMIRLAKPADVHNGKVIYDKGCIACHGSMGKGAPETSTVFTRPDTFPDFTRCDQTTAETNAAYKDVIVYGGPARGFSTIMPAFGKLL